LALAIRLQRLIREQTIPDYAEVARRGHVTRARMTQIMKLLDLAPDIQEETLFLPPLPRLNERNLRPIVSRIDWHEQRRLFQELTRLAVWAKVGTRPDVRRVRQCRMSWAASWSMFSTLSGSPCSRATTELFWRRTGSALRRSRSAPFALQSIRECLCCSQLSLV
jgi:hypothetical protein